ncbi:MAG: type II toxin-antitoxin system PemK/MazF family toxin [Streptosporangiales bacterium]|nr:type II toxin-antitoxin system PemK/MazF family toxin [Streptosporangiales bacterium]
MTDFSQPIGHEQGFRRPAVVVSADGFNASGLDLAVVVPVTTRKRNWSMHVELEPGESGLRDVSWAKVEDIKSVSTLRLVHQLGVVDPLVLDRIGAIARVLLDL